VILVGILSIRFIGPGIPREIYLLTGPEGTPFDEDGQRYKEYLEDRGVKVHLVRTGGSIDNLRALATEEGPRAGFVEAGIEAQVELEGKDRLTSLGSLYLEPFWLFVRADLAVQSLEDLTNIRVSLGPEGTAVRRLAMQILELNGLTEKVDWEPYSSVGGPAAADAVRDGNLDAFFIMAPPEIPALQSIIHSPALKPVSFRRAAAYGRRLPYIAAITLPEGTLDFRLDIPETDLQQLAASVNMVVNDEIPPALVYLLLDAGVTIHSERTLYSEPGQFPSPQYRSLPLNQSADEYFRTGPPPLQRILPFWLASIVDRFLGFVAAVGGTALAVFGVIPRLFGMVFEFNTNRYWRRLEKIEKQAAAGGDRGEVLARLDKLLEDSAALRVPIHLQPAYFELRQAMHDMKDRLGG